MFADFCLVYFTKCQLIMKAIVVYDKLSVSKMSVNTKKNSFLAPTLCLSQNFEIFSRNRKN